MLGQVILPPILPGEYIYICLSNLFFTHIFLTNSNFFAYILNLIDDIAGAAAAAVLPLLPLPLPLLLPPLLLHLRKLPVSLPPLRLLPLLPLLLPSLLLLPTAMV